ncbi:MAG TPA: hypothetical protein VGG05_28430 [Pseudonocardiaceae bacterium]
MTKNNQSAAELSAAMAVLSPQEQAALDVVGRVLGATALTESDPDRIALVRPDGMQAALVEATVGEQRDHELAHLRRESDLRWPAPARWWWHVVVDDVRCLRRVREVFPVAARACEAHDVCTPGLLSLAVTGAVPDLHWLVHTAPARMFGHADVLDMPATVSITAAAPSAGGMAAVVPALEHWLASARAVRAVDTLARSQADERHLYLTVDYTGLAPHAFDALVRADGVPRSPVRGARRVSHLWVTPVFGRTVYLWSRRDGWSRHEPYG